MLIGHQKPAEVFKHLIKEEKVSHGYLFFGEPEIGKFSFALELAAYLETGKFQNPPHPLAETLVIYPNKEGVIGIDDVRELKHFLFQKPVYSLRRTVIIENVDLLTAQAEHAILKITEEPPPSSLILLIASNPEVLLPTLQSRLQKIYFPRVSSNLIINMLVANLALTKEQATKISKASFGRPGRAIKLAENSKQKVESGNKKVLIEKMLENTESLKDGFTEIIADLAQNPVKNYKELKSILNRLNKISQFNTNKRLQLESALWNI